MSELRIAIYDGMTTLGAVGPMDVLRFLPEARVELVAVQPGPVRTDSGVLELIATTSYDECRSPARGLAAAGAPDDDVDHVRVLWLAAARARGPARRRPRRLPLRCARPAPPARSRAVALGRPHGAIPEFYEAPVWGINVTPQRSALFSRLR